MASILQHQASVILGEETQIPLWIKLSYTLFVCVAIPVYCVNYPLDNFLWFSDIAMLTAVPALWMQSSLLASMMALAITIPEAIWNVGFFGRLIFGKDISGLAAYMFDSQLDLYVRALSLFHIFLPALLLWMVWRLGYDSRAFWMQTALMVVVLMLVYLFSPPSHNVNWVFGPKGVQQHGLSPRLYLLLLAAIFVGAIYLPTHLVLRRLFGRS